MPQTIRNSKIVSPKPWPEEDLATLTEMSAAGYRAQDIANAIGRTKNAVIGQWKRLGDRCPHTDNHGFTWNNHDVEKLRKMWISNVPVPDIAKALDRSPRAVQDKLRRLSRTPVRQRVVAKPPVAKPPPPQRVKPPAIPASNPVRFVDREPRQCGFILGEVNGVHTMVCGNPILAGSYCLTHYRLCHGWNRVPAT
jgi:hypothetical protein